MGSANAGLSKKWSDLLNALDSKLAAVPMGSANAGLSKKWSAPIFVAFAFAILLGTFFLMQLHFSGDTRLVLWLILVVVATDIAGYFGGKAFGGPKIWPSVSPKKTWSGAIAGWASAALVGLAFAVFFETASVWAAVAASTASQSGDFAESWLKRQADVKDSSSLIPGHGGVLDRFDGLVGASVAALALQSLGWL